MYRTRLFAVLIAVVAGAGLIVVGPSPAHAEPHWCATGCDGKSPNEYVTMSDGTRVRCADTQRVVGGPYYPFITGAPPTYYQDAFLPAYHMYSTNCQTTWLLVKNTKAIGRTRCAMWELRTSAPRYQANGTCPSVGHSSTTGMVDDHDPQGRAIAFGHVEVDNPNSGWPTAQVDTDYY